jgi:hypothetical protein
VFYEADELKRLYGHHDSPQTIADLNALMDMPEFVDDPKRRGAVILDREWISENLVIEWFPLLGQRYVNRLIVVPLMLAMSEIDMHPDSDYREYIKPKQCGVFNPRRINWRPGNPLSFHAIACATDLNWIENAYGKPGSIRSFPAIPKIMKKHGFYWGGDWRTKDDMHFQWGNPRIKLPR